VMGDGLSAFSNAAKGIASYSAESLKDLGVKNPFSDDDKDNDTDNGQSGSSGGSASRTSANWRQP